jgi:hypothetical protein
MVTAGNGTITFLGDNGKYYSYNFYSSDVLAAYCTFSTVGAAGTGSQTFFNAPANITLVDISFASTNTVSTQFVPQVNDIPVGNIIAIANVLNTLAYRAFPKIGVSKGSKFTLVQA